MKGSLEEGITQKIKLTKTTDMQNHNANYPIKHN